MGHILIVLETTSELFSNQHCMEAAMVYSVQILPLFLDVPSSSNRDVGEMCNTSAFGKSLKVKLRRMCSLNNEFAMPE